jgi:hypothetical protein
MHSKLLGHKIVAGIAALLLFGPITLSPTRAENSLHIGQIDARNVQDTGNQQFDEIILLTARVRDGMKTCSKLRPFLFRGATETDFHALFSEGLTVEVWEADGQIPDCYRGGRDDRLAILRFTEHGGDFYLNDRRLGRGPIVGRHTIRGDGYEYVLSFELARD